MDLDFYDLFKTYESNKLKDIVKNKSEYQNRAVETAIQILKERNIYDDFVKEQEIQEREKQEFEKKQQKKISAKKCEVSLSECNRNNQIHFDYGEEFDFEGKLQKRKIKYNRQDFFHKWHKVVFYFPDSELEKIDKLICKINSEVDNPNKDYLKKVTRPIDRFFSIFLKVSVYLFIIGFLSFLILGIIDILTDGKISHYMFVRKN